jgi:hypothetical protein
MLFPAAELQYEHDRRLLLIAAVVSVLVYAPVLLRPILLAILSLLLVLKTRSRGTVVL